MWLTSAYGGADELHVSMMVSFFLSFKFAKNINENKSLAKKKTWNTRQNIKSRIKTLGIWPVHFYFIHHSEYILDLNSMEKWDMKYYHNPLAKIKKKHKALSFLHFQNLKLA